MALWVLLRAVSVLHKDDESEHGSVVDMLVMAFVRLNATKNKDMLIDFRRKPSQA